MIKCFGFSTVLFACGGGGQLGGENSDSPLLHEEGHYGPTLLSHH